MTFVLVLSHGLFLEPLLLPSSTPPSSPPLASSLYNDHPLTSVPLNSKPLSDPQTFPLHPSSLSDLLPQAWLPPELEAHLGISFGGCSSSARGFTQKKVEFTSLLTGQWRFAREGHTHISKAGRQETEKQSQCQRAGLGGESKQSDNVVGPECNIELPGSPCKRGNKTEE